MDITVLFQKKSIFGIIYSEFPQINMPEPLNENTKLHDPDGLSEEPRKTDTTGEITDATKQKVNAVAPASFEEMTSGTVFKFNRPDYPAGYFVWDGKLGGVVSENEATRLSRMKPNKRLDSMPSRVQTCKFGNASDNHINQDFSLVEIMGETT